MGDTQIHSWELGINTKLSRGIDCIASEESVCVYIFIFYHKYTYRHSFSFFRFDHPSFHCFIIISSTLLLLNAKHLQAHGTQTHEQTNKYYSIKMIGALLLAPIVLLGTLAEGHIGCGGQEIAKRNPYMVAGSGKFGKRQSTGYDKNNMGESRADSRQCPSTDSSNRMVG
jgi:hypothetical protein